MTRPLRTPLILTLVTALAACATKPEENDGRALGIEQADTEQHDAGIYLPVGSQNFDAIAERGRMLYDMERGLRLGYERGLFKVGDPGTDTVLPLVDVDPGGKSGQVLFVRWKHEDIPDAANLDPTKAQRWLLVSLVLWPDNVLDIEQLQGYVQEGSLEHRRIAALLQAAKKAAELQPDQMFHMHVIAEEIPAENKRPVRGAKNIQLHAYLFAAERGGTDLDMILEVQKKGPPEVMVVKTPHEAGDVGDKLVHARSSEPGPMTIMRVLQMGHTSGDVLVETQGGVTWNVSTRDGTMSRQ